MTHATYHAEDAEIRVFPAGEPYDRSDMYVMEVLGATVSLRLIPAGTDRPGRLQIVIEAPAPFTASINGDSNDYGDES